MNRLFVGLLTLLFSTAAFASGGFTWISTLSHNLHLHVPETILTFILIATVLIAIGLFYRYKTKSVDIIVPDKGISYRNLVEAFGEFIYNLARSIMGEHQAKKFFPVICLLFIFIFLSNVIGLIPGFLPPTANINTTLALGMFVFIYYNIMGVKELGLVAHVKHFMGPVWYLAFLIFPIELISHSVRPISLALRLKGNMEGDHMVLAIFSDLVPYGIPIVFLVLGLFVCFIQAFVFTLLSMVYISLATAHHDHDEHEAH